MKKRNLLETILIISVICALFIVCTSCEDNASETKGFLKIRTDDIESISLMRYGNEATVSPEAQEKIVNLLINMTVGRTINSTGRTGGSEYQLRIYYTDGSHDRFCYSASQIRPDRDDGKTISYEDRHENYFQYLIDLADEICEEEP